jgi:hypothetical protein
MKDLEGSVNLKSRVNLGNKATIEGKTNPKIREKQGKICELGLGTMGLYYV